MEKYIVIYYYKFCSVEEVDVRAICDTFLQAKDKMKEDYEDFLESAGNDSNIEKYITRNDAHIKCSNGLCHWNIRKISI